MKEGVGKSTFFLSVFSPLHFPAQIQLMHHLFSVSPPHLPLCLALHFLSLVRGALTVIVECAAMEWRERRRDVGGERLDQCLAILTVKTFVVWLVLAGWLRERKLCGELDLLQLLLLFLIC